MSYQHKPNRGSLFRNDRKEKESHPDYKGDAVIDGVDYWLSAWVNEGKKGKYFSFSFQKKDEVHNQGMGQTQQVLEQSTSPQNHGGKTAADFEDDIPW